VNPKNFGKPVLPIVPKRVNEQWHTDFKGPIRVFTVENKVKKMLTFYILFTVDSFSKFVWGKVFLTKDAEPVALYMRQLIIEEDCPLKWTSDNGGEFVNEVMATVLTAFQDETGQQLIKEIHGRPLHPEVILLSLNFHLIGLIGKWCC
jgi:hypothetical protein